MFHFGSANVNDIVLLFHCLLVHCWHIRKWLSLIDQKSIKALIIFIPPIYSHVPLEETWRKINSINFWQWTKFLPQWGLDCFAFYVLWVYSLTVALTVIHYSSPTHLDFLVTAIWNPFSSIAYSFPVSGSAVPTVRPGLHTKLITELLKVASTHLTILFLTVLVKGMSSQSSHCGSVGLKWQIHCLSIKPREGGPACSFFHSGPPFHLLFSQPTKQTVRTLSDSRATH